MIADFRLPIADLRIRPLSVVLCPLRPLGSVAFDYGRRTTDHGQPSSIENRQPATSDKRDDLPVPRFSALVFYLSKRINDAQAFEAAEIAVTGE
jgi:hypothetical protein